MKSLWMLLMSAAVCSTIHADELQNESSLEQIHNHFQYVDFGLGPLPLPVATIGTGYRQQVGHHGSDFSMQVSTIVFATALKASIVYHYYFKPNLESQYYTGLGAGMSAAITAKKDSGAFVSPEFVLGRQYKNHLGETRFLQAKFDWPVMKWNHLKQVTNLPFITISYGMAF